MDMLIAVPFCHFLFFLFLFLLLLFFYFIIYYYLFVCVRYGGTSLQRPPLRGQSLLGILERWPFLLN